MLLVELTFKLYLSRMKLCKSVLWSSRGFGEVNRRVQPLKLEDNHSEKENAFYPVVSVITVYLSTV